MSERSTTPRAVLGESALLRGFSAEALDRLAASARAERFDRGSLLIAEGEPAERFGVIAAGRVNVSHLRPDGRRVALETAEKGESFAAVAALAGGRHPATVEAVTPGTAVWVERDDLLAAIEHEPAAARVLLQDLASRLVRLTDVVRTLSLDVPGRLAGYLFGRALSVGKATPSGLEVDLGMTKAELAQSLGTVPETLSRALARLRDEGVLEVRGGTVLVYDVSALAKMGSGYEEA